jgi:branched-chain amino acid aminotransferase
MSEKAYLNGDLVSFAEATVSVSSPSLLHGVGLFETLRSYEGRPFRLSQHVDRISRSARYLDMPVSEAIDQIPHAVTAVLESNKLKNARVRITVAPPGSHGGNDRAMLLVAAQEALGYPPELYQQGMTVHVGTQWRQSSQDPLVGHKTTSYFSRLLALRAAQAAGCGEGLWFTPDNRLAQGCVSNVFLVKGGRLRTPPLDTPVLPGITRGVVLELAGWAGIPAEESPCTINDLLDADEVFLANTTMEIMPVIRVERKAIAGEKPGPVASQLARAYTELTREVEPAG